MIYDTLLQLPIFQGLSHKQLTSILERTPFHFQKYKAREEIVRVGAPCNKVLFVLSGTVRHIVPSYDDKVRVVQIYEAPHTMPFYYLFGVRTTSPDTLIAETDVGIMSLEKSYFLQLLQENVLPLVNVLNMLSSHAQKQHSSIDFCGKISGEDRLASWLLANTDRAAKSIEIDAKVSDLCMLLHMDVAEYWRSVIVLEGKHLVESSGEVLKLIDRYALRGYVNSK